MNAAPKSAHLSELTLLGVTAHSLSGQALAEAQQHLAACETCAAKLRELERLGREFSTEVFPRTVDQVSARASSRTAVARWWLAPAAGLVLSAAAASALWVRPGPSGEPGAPETPSEVRPKGEPGFKVLAARGQAVFPVDDGRSLLAPGDRIRFVLRPAGLPYALVAAVDGGGKVTVYYPFGGRQSASIPPERGEVVLPGSIRLDDAPGPERIFLLQSKAPLSARAVERALAPLARKGPAAIRTTTRIDLPVEAQSSVLFNKPGLPARSSPDLRD